MMVTIDDETLARAVLTFCLDSADAMMYALVKGTGSAASALQLIADSGPGNHKNVTTAACTSLDAAFINGVTRWGRTINARGMASFHGSLVSWQQRLASLPSKDPDAIARLVHSRRHAVDHRPASPLLAQPTERPFTAHRLGLPALPMGQRRSEGAGVMPRAGGYRRLTGRKRLR